MKDKPAFPLRGADGTLYDLRWFDACGDTSIDALVERLSASEDFSQGEQLLLYIRMTDAAAVMEELKMRAVMVKVGMTTVTKSDAFLYGLLKLSNPEFFEGS